MTDYLSFSFRFQGSDGALAAFLKLLGIPPERQFIGRLPANHDHLGHRLSAAEGGPLTGDFRIGAEVFLFDVPADEIARHLRNGSRGCAISVPSEAPGASPFADLLWLDGELHKVEVLEDEVTEEVFVSGHDDLRRQLDALKPRSQTGL